MWYLDYMFLLKKKNFEKSNVLGCLLLFLTICSTAQEQLHTLNGPIINPQEKTGPLWIKNKLIKEGVFIAPSYSFTNDYDEHKQFPNIKGLFFKGLPYNGKQTKVFCWYGLPNGLLAGEKRPAVVLVHGGGGTAFPEWVKKWTDKGYIAMAVALEGQVPGERVEHNTGEKLWPGHEYSGPRRIGFFEDVVTKKLEDQWFYHAVADVILASSLLKSFPEVDAQSIGISGISWGGILTNVITGIDNRYAFAIPVYGCGFLQETPHYKKLLAGLTTEQQQFYLQNWEPSLYLSLQEQPSLFVNGTNDFHFTMNSFTKTYKASKNEKYLYIEHNMKHGHRPGWEPEEIYAFADYIVKNGKRPLVPKFKGLRKKDQLVYECDEKATEAYLYTTTDTADWGRDNYTWQQTSMDFSKTGRIISAKLPSNTQAYFVNIRDSEGMMYSSPMRMVNKK
ncbi:dipeptidyl aminopeptidase [Arenibacter aquaticus]|uniref:Dipeptidyl aminopeptidase n=1 Tax=Arenibacter aquaticus TaxID=2489054 RepID=A0A3S0C9Y7_9FLAO|nr:acetylxylan esterase [Arenibacter aquaticus]RTE55463.1 dipeptidyl aminopeptidase [Arenibacter aquaticus]